MSKKEQRNQLWLGLGLIIIAVVLVTIIIVKAMEGETTGDVTISGEAKVTGLTCKNKTLAHPAFTSKPANSYMNTVTTTFWDDKLSSISLLAEGNYDTEQMMEEAKAFAEADYNLTLANKYGEKIDVFSANFTVNGTKLQLAQTTRDIGKINTNTVTYFLLDQGTDIQKSLDGLKKQYESKGFTCEKSE